MKLREADAPRIRHRIARSALETGDANRARTEWVSLLEEGLAGELEPEAVFGLGRAWVRLRNFPEARRRFREVNERWKDSDFAPRALIALGNTWNPLKTRRREDLDRGLDSWREFRRLYHGHEEGPSIAYSIGLALANFGDRAQAVTEWQAFLERWPDHERSPEAQHGIALSKLGLEDFDGAVKAWSDLLAKWPHHSLWTTARGMLPRTAMARAETAMREKDWTGAAAAFRRYLDEYPADGDAAQGQMRLGDALEEGGKRDDALEAWRLATRKYPEDPRAPQAWERVARVLAEKVGDLPASIREYEGLARRYPRSNQGRRAAETLTAMKGKELEASLDRPLTTDRKPRIAFRLRNVDRLRMKAYRVDMVEYVRTKGSLAGAEHVVTDVVKPDAEWVWKPENYEPFRLLERTCELPVKGPGAWIVRAQDEELSATIMVVSTDLAAVVKRSREQTLVYVQNELTGKPVAGATVLLPGGEDAVTGADGVWIGGAGGDGKVLVSHGGHATFAHGNAGRRTTFGYSPKVYLFPDRPLVRPGQKVALKGFARRVVSGSYACREGEKVEITVEDPRRATVLKRTLVTDEFGGIDTQLELPFEAVLGDYRVLARYEKRSFTTTFAVRAFRKPELEVTVTGESSTWYLGDEVKAGIRVRYGAGGAVRNAPVRWRMGRTGFVFDGSDLASYASWFRDPKREAERRRRRAAEGDFVELASGEIRTDEKGLATITFPTDDAAGDGRYVLEVMVQDSGGTWVRDAAAFPVTRRGLYAVVRSERRVVRPGQDIPMEVFTVDARQDPRSVKGRAVLARRRRVGDRMVDEEVTAVPVTTAENGRAAVKLKAPRPGEYALLFVAEDGRGNAVKGRATMTVAGDAEDLSRDLRLVCDRETYREGDEAEILLNVPGAPASVLLTFEGERVLEHRLVRPDARSSTIRVPMRSLFAPNVFVRATMLREGELLESGDEVLVFRFLNVSVEPSGPTSLPGKDVGVVVRTTDQRGNPVEASVAVAAVDRALLRLQPDRTPDPRPYFYDQRRTLGVATTSSWAHLPAATTRPTNKDLLFEEARRLGREGFERMTKHVRMGRNSLKTGKLEEAMEEVRKALDLSPGNHEARALLARIQGRMSSVEDEKRYADAKQSLGDELAKTALRKRAESQDARFKDKGLSDRYARKPAASKKAPPPGAPAPEPTLGAPAE
ncbi:MAG: MG2 domain-containing protein, partial [Planctomycetota bacterium]